MLHLANFCLFTLLFLNLFGLALVTGLWLRNAWLALTAGPWLFCSLGFFIESFHGFGALAWMWPITTILSMGLLLEVTGQTNFFSRWNNPLKLEEWKRELSPLQSPLAYGVFITVFSYVMLWRYRFPSIDASSEKIADLACLTSYLSGETIPVHDSWLYPFLSTHYYGFQYYAGALLGRILGVEPGVAYNLAFCTIIAMAGTAGIGAICQAAAKLWIRLLVSIAWLFGGSGVTILIYFVIKNPILCNNFRFIGDPAFNVAPIGTFLTEYAKNYTPLSLPGEPLSYSIFLGDYHPPLSGFYLLALALLVFNLWAKGAHNSVLILVGANLPWCAVADTWNLPLEVLGLTGWGLYNFKNLSTGAWKYLLGGAIAGMVAVYPYYRLFATSAEDYHTAFRWVPWDQHTPPLLWLLFLLPTFGLTILGLCSGDRPTAALGMLWLGFLLFTECFFINDIYLGQFLRFNTTLKWWPWVATGTLLTLAPRLLQSFSKPWIWFPALFFVSYPIFYFWDLASDWSNLPTDYVGQLDGSGYLTIDKSNPRLNDRLLLNYLRTAPRGVVVEHPDTDFTNYAAMTTLSGQQAYLGWLGHEQLWRGYLYELQYRYDKLQALYDGNLPNAGEWMQSQRVDYILWFKNYGAEQAWDKSTDVETLWDKVNASLQPQYVWHEFYHEPTRRVGLWEKRKSN